MTAWKTWWQRRSGILREPAIAPRLAKMGKFSEAKSSFTIDGGAYATLSSVVLSRGTIHAGGPYYWPSVRIRAKAVATNTPPHGAFRDLARRRASLPWSGTWTASPKPWGSLQSKSADEISVGEGRARRNGTSARIGVHPRWHLDPACSFSRSVFRIRLTQG